ncbi:MAG: PAS domain S-box protein, partial [Promethearchaeota archaeon]
MNELINDFINLIPDLVVIFNSNGKIIDVSQNVLDFYNIPNSNYFIGKDISVFVVSEQHEELRKNFEELKIKGSIKQQEYKVLKADGSFFYAELNTKALDVKNGEEGYFITILRDVTPQKTLLAELNKSKQMFQLVLDNIPQHIFWKDLNSKYLGCNKNFARVAGIKKPETIVGKTDFDLAWKYEEAESFNEIDHLVIESGTPEFHVIEPQLQADGKQAWLDINRIPLYNSEGKVIGLLGTYEDITERKIAGEKLEESERKYRNIVKNSLDGISLTNEQGDIIEWNQSMENITGFTQDEVLGQPVWEVQFPLVVETDKTPEIKQQLKNGVLSILKKGDFSFPTQIREQEIQDRNGSHKILQTSSYLIKTDLGMRIGTIMRDISKQKEAEQEIEKSKARFKNIVENINELIVVTDFNGKHIYVSPKYNELLGRSSKSRNILFETIHEEDRNKLID